MYVSCLHKYKYIMCIPGIFRGKKVVSLETIVWMIVGHYVGAGN